MRVQKKKYNPLGEDFQHQNEGDSSKFVAVKEIRVSEASNTFVVGMIVFHFFFFFCIRFFLSRDSCGAKQNRKTQKHINTSKFKKTYTEENDDLPAPPTFLQKPRFSMAFQRRGSVSPMLAKNNDRAFGANKKTTPPPPVGGGVPPPPPKKQRKPIPPPQQPGVLKNADNAAEISNLNTESSKLMPPPVLLVFLCFFVHKANKITLIFFSLRKISTKEKNQRNLLKIKKQNNKQ